MKKFLSLFLCVLLLGLSACGSADSSEPSTIVISASSLPEPEPEPLQAAYLTGLEKGADYPENQRVIGVIVGNTPNARPAYGLSEAQILVECEANAGITRFMAIYEDYKTMPTVGSVRSARDPFVQILIPTYGFFVHSGPAENQPARVMLEQYEYYDNYDLDGAHWTESSRSTSIFNWYNTDAQTVTAAIEKKGYDDTRTYNSTFFSFTPYNEPRRELTDGEIDEVTVIHTPGFRSYFAYDSASGRYDMSQFNSYTGNVEPTIDANNNQQVAFDNVVVLFAPFDVYPNTGSERLARVDFGTMGVGYYFNGGQYEVIRWKKGAPDAPLRLYVNDTTETPLDVNPGTTYLGIVTTDELEDFYNQITTDSGADEAGDGEVVSEEYMETD